MNYYKLSIITTFILTANLSFAQECDCEKNYNWVKQTFEQNDAGFQFVLQTKGEKAYKEHNAGIEARIKVAKTPRQCLPIIYEWMTFFRTGHIAIRPKMYFPEESANNSTNSKEKWPTLAFKLDEFKKYLSTKSSDQYEGIWNIGGTYTIGIKKEKNEYIGFIITSEASEWSPGQIKLRFTENETESSIEYFMRDRSIKKYEEINMIGKNYLELGDNALTKVFPIIEEDPKFTHYLKAMNANEAFLEKLNETTLYLRMPSFDHNLKPRLDSILANNHQLITSTPNLIIDIRNNGGGSDVTYANIMPYLYTNPVREVGVEFYSTPLNNQRMLDFINNPDYGFDEAGKKWAQESYDVLSKRIGEYVNLSSERVTIAKLDTVYQYPQNVGILIHKQNASSAEQFILEAKQSKKVKLFGTTTYGMLDMSNMYFVESPCGEFELGYTLTRSLRIPQFQIDEIGLQPDFFIDSSIPNYDWVNFVNNILNE